MGRVTEYFVNHDLNLGHVVGAVVAAEGLAMDAGAGIYDAINHSVVEQPVMTSGVELLALGGVIAAVSSFWPGNKKRSAHFPNPEAPTLPGLHEIT